jgi:P4 family phage/plasmid primase-like protien
VHAAGADGPAGGDEYPADHPDRLAAVVRRKGRLVYWKRMYYRYEGARYCEFTADDMTNLAAGEILADYRAGHAEACRRARAAHAAALAGGAGKPGRPPAYRRPVAPALTTRRMADVMLHLRAGVAVSPPEGPPCLLSDYSRPDLLPVANGLLDLGTRTLRPHTDDYFSTVLLPYAYLPQATCPGWLAALGRCFPGDAQRIELVRQWFGYNLVASTAAQRFLVMCGEGHNGKSVVCAALVALLGRANVSSVPLEDFARPFGLAGTVGKLANVCAEVGELDRTHEGRLKMFTSGDLMQFERKYCDPTEALPTARLTFATNNPPRFADRSEGLWRRLLLLPFDRVIPGAERVPGMDKPSYWEASGELPGMLNWALDGLASVRAAGWQFAVPAACAAALEAHRGEANPARAFLALACRRQTGAGGVPCQVLYAGYQDWCAASGHRPLSATQFGKEVHRAFPWLGVPRQVREGGGNGCAATRASPTSRRRGRRVPRRCLAADPPAECPRPPRTPAGAPAGPTGTPPHRRAGVP